MSDHGFCTRCGKTLEAGNAFCTTCGASTAALSAAKTPQTLPPATKANNNTVLAVGALLLVVGGAAAFFSMRESTEVPRAVPGSPTASAPAPAPEGGLPGGHPSIELPKEVLEFLDGLSAAADKDPKSIEAAQTLARARYRATVINASYRVSAEKALAKLMALDPTNVEGMRISANLAYDTGDYADAQKRFELFLSKHPGDPAALTDLGSAHLFQEHIDEAIKSYDAALAVDPKFMQAHFNKGIALQKQGKKAEAAASLNRASENATQPEEKQHIENALAEVEGREPKQLAGTKPPHPNMAPASGVAPGAPQGHTQGGMPMPPPAPDRDVTTNASSDFQKQAEKPLITHSIVGPRLASFDWTTPTTVRVIIADFPMEQMPPFAREKFRTGMADKIAAVAKQQGITDAVTLEITDKESGRVMETIVATPGGGASSGGAPTPQAAPSAPE